jgi:hypothetical protein
MSVLPAAASLFATMSAFAVPAQQSTPGGGAPAETSPVSVERVGEGLKRPEGLRIPPMPEPPAVQFRIEVEGLFRTESVLDGVRRDLGARPGVAAGRPTGPGSPLAGGGMDLLGLAKGLVNSFNDARRARAERNTRREVQEALAAFCRVHDCSIVEQGPPPPEGIALPPPVTGERPEP